MGAFFLYPTNSLIDAQKAKSIFSQKGLNSYREVTLGNYSLLLYQKMLVDDQNIYASGSDFICSVGTLIYKGQTPLKSIGLLYNDLLNKTVDYNKLLGTFCVIAYVGSRLYVFNDDENLYPIYLHHDFDILSSSFLAVCEVCESLTINNLSVKESIVTGCSFGFDTYFNEVKRYRWANEVLLPKGIEHYPVHKTILLNTESKLRVEQKQEEVIEAVFKGLALTANENGCELGLSSGYDSRLLLALSLRYFNKSKIIIGSNYKNPPDNDLQTARHIAETIEKKLGEVPVVSTQKMTTKEFQENIERAFLFYDGQFRANHGWTRQYRTSEYRKKVLNGCKMGASGHAGEMLRNDYNLDSGLFSYNLWIKNNLLGKSGQKRLGTRKEVDEMVYYIKQKLKHIIKPDSKYINKRKAHQYYNEAWVPSGPGIRASIENQISYYVSPFTDYNISKTAYNLVPYLNRGAGYEKRLVGKYFKSLSSIPYEIKTRAITIPIIYTTMVYRLGFDIHNFMKNVIRGRNKKLNIQFVESTKNTPLLDKLISNPLLNRIFPLNLFIKNCSDESELDRLIAFAFVCNRYEDKIVS